MPNAKGHADADTLDLRRRRAVYRASHRGTKEMDWLLGRFTQAIMHRLEDPKLALLEQLLALPDPELQELLMTGASLPDDEIGALLSEIRAHHGLSA